MSFDRERERWSDVVENIDAILEYVSGMTARTFAADRKTIDAVERCLQRITEAVIQLGDASVRAIDPELPTHAIRGLGNMLRHEYGRIDQHVIFDTIHSDLPMLRNAAVRALAGER